MACGFLEMEILNTFWKLNSENEDKDISIQNVVDELSSNGVERAYTTIKTVMDRLVSKSILVRYKTGKKFFYKVTMDKREMALEMMKEFTDNFFDGDIAKMVRFVERETVELLVK
jgi:predicted transcriptional regulator